MPVLTRRLSFSDKKIPVKNGLEKKWYSNEQEHVPQENKIASFRKRTRLPAQEVLFVVTWPKTLFLDRYYFHPRHCVCVCRWVCISIISISSWPILMKLGRMMYNYKRRQVPFKNGMNRFGRTHTSPIWNVEIAIS